jgi:hypothetical protein
MVQPPDAQLVKVVNSFRITLPDVIDFAPCKCGLPYECFFDKLIKKITSLAMIARETKTPTSFKLSRYMDLYFV